MTGIYKIQVDFQGLLINIGSINHLETLENKLPWYSQYLFYNSQYADKESENVHYWGKEKIDRKKENQ